KRMWDPNYTETVGDIIFPPGGHIHIGLSYYFDHTLELAMVVQFVQSVLLPLILAMIGYELYGRRVAFVTLVLASIYYPFIDYAAYFMTEGPYVFYLALSMWLLIRSLRVGSAKVGLLFALLAGVMLGITAAFKTVVLACSAMIFLQLSLVAYRSKWRRPAILLAGSTVGLLVLVIPMTIRATRINDGKLTTISTNGALTVLMGHSGEIGTFHFNDRKRRRTYWFGSPAANQRGYKKQLSLPYGPWDSSEMLRDAWRWTRENPAAAFRLSCQNVLDLFQGSLAFPSVGEPRWKPWMYWFQRFYWIFILLPSLVHLAFNFRRLSDMQGPGLADSLLLLPLLGLMAVSFFTIGQPRYRIPFDAFQILLAARWYTGGLARRDGLVPWRERTGEKASHEISEAPDRGQPMASHRLQTRFGLAAVAVAFVVALLFSETPEADRREPQRRRPAAQATPKLSSIVAPNVVLQNTLVGHESYVTGVAFSPDGQLLATSSYDNTVRLWDVVTGQLQQTYDGHEGYVRAVRFAPDGRVLASCSNDGTIRLWDVAQGNCLITLTGHDGPVRDVAFSPDGTILASGGKDRSVRLWNVKEGTLEQTLEGHRSWVNC
ncbi:MAG: glycosyltransferase family 39 protein, partial [Pirellulales bacterium]